MKTLKINTAGKKYEIDKMLELILGKKDLTYALKYSKKDEVKEKDILGLFYYYKGNTTLEVVDNFEADLIIDLEIYAFMLQEEYMKEELYLKDIEGIFEPNGKLELLIKK